jgi:hypothetical protein
MAGRVRSRKGAQLEHSCRLRADGATWAEIAAVFRTTYGVNSRVAARLAHGWSQADAAEQWNEMWPNDSRTFKNFSYWEQWPAATGYAPSLEVLTRLAELYQCRMADLLDDGPDYTHSDEMQRARQDVALFRQAVSDSSAAHTKRITKSVADDEVATRRLSEFVSRLQETDVDELARTMAAWGRQVDPAIDRRSLLLKLSFALSLAAVAPEPDSIARPRDRAFAGTADFSGVWRSRYSYHSVGRKQEFDDEHYVVVRQNGRQLAVESLPHSTGSEVGMALTVDAHAATGTWAEHTSPTGYYKGATYRGAIQLMVSPTGRQLSGKWIGFGKRFAINSGDWELTLEDRSTTKSTLRAYNLKV